MSDANPTADAPAGDPFRTVADAMSQAAGDDADAKAHVAGMMPAGGGFLARLAYNTSYAVSYGVVFPALLLARAVPRENAMVHGLIDGAHAARDAVLGRDRAADGATIPGSEDH